MAKVLCLPYPLIRAFHPEIDLLRQLALSSARENNS